MCTIYFVHFIFRAVGHHTLKMCTRDAGPEQLNGFGANEKKSKMAAAGHTCRKTEIQVVDAQLSKISFVLAEKMP